MTGRERRALRLLIDEARRERVRREQEDAPDVGREPYWRAYYQRNREKIRAQRSAHYASNRDEIRAKRRNAHNAAQPQKGGRR